MLIYDAVGNSNYVAQPQQLKRDYTKFSLKSFISVLLEEEFCTMFTEVNIGGEVYGRMFEEHVKPKPEQSSSLPPTINKSTSSMTVLTPTVVASLWLVWHTMVWTNRFRKRFQYRTLDSQSICRPMNGNWTYIHTSRRANVDNK